MNLNQDQITLLQTIQDLAGDRDVATNYAISDKLGWELQLVNKHLSALKATGYLNINATAGGRLLVWLDGYGKMVLLNPNYWSKKPTPPEINFLGTANIAMLNTGQVENIESINQNIGQLTESGNAEVAEAIKQMTEAVAKLNEEQLSSDDKEGILDTLEVLSTQASLAPQERFKTGAIKAMWNGLNTSIQSAGGLAAVWATWELVIRSFFGF
ncbi:MAG: hypothetical protein ACPGWR_15000 [Ardenticatenaceae bacterium]